MKPVAIDLFCGLGGWTKGFLAEGYEVIGFDIEHKPSYPGHYIEMDVAKLCGYELRAVNPNVIVASPPCQAYSYRAMPWKRAKALPPPDNALFDACFRIAREAGCPLVVENVKGAQPWVGRAKWHYGSFYLWGDVPALMPPVGNGRMKFPAHCGPRLWKDRDVPRLNYGENSHRDAFHQGTKGFAQRFEDTPMARLSSKSEGRKAASAAIAEIPFDLAQWIARCFK